MRTAATLTSIAVLALGIINAADAAETAETAEGAKSVVVHFADLDLSKAEDSAVLFHRLKRAARKVCELPRHSSLEVKRVNEACVEFALANAIAKMNRPMLTQYAVDRNGRST